MILLWIIGIIVGLCLFAHYGDRYCHTEAYQNKLLSTTGVYLGGSSQTYNSGFEAIVMVSKKEFIISPCIGQGTDNDNIIIPIENIKLATTKSEQEIRHKMTLGRIALFGVFAKPKEYKKINKYLYVDYYNKENETETVILECNQAVYVIERILYHKNKSKNKSKSINKENNVCKDINKEV